MKLTRRTLVFGAMAAPIAARAQSWPPANIRVVVSYPPGGSSEAIMRLAQVALQEKLGTTVIVENRAGASGSVGTARCLHGEAVGRAARRRRRASTCSLRRGRSHGPGPSLAPSQPAPNYELTPSVWQPL